MSESTDFIRRAIDQSLADDPATPRITTRFPPEPNGYLHIGHAKAICLNFGIAAEYDGACNLRLDDTNPMAESGDYVEAIQRDVTWLGFQWHELTHASDYFEKIYAVAERLVEGGQAYVDDQSREAIQANRGTLTEAGTASPWRDRPAAENLDLLRRMRAGEFGDGDKVLRARIDMASPNLTLRDPVLCRIRHTAHHRTGDGWCIYPTYDFTHPLSDAFEGITHSLCTLEFEDHRPFYDWLVGRADLNGWPPRQIEFSRLGLEHTVMSKRLLRRLVEEDHVAGWDDPRMPTIAGLRRRGYTPASIREFCDRVGVTRQDNTVEMSLLEFCIRQDLESQVPRGMAVLDPLKVVITNFEGEETLRAPWHPKADLGEREIPLRGEVFIERTDFVEVAPNRKYRRLALGEQVRLRYGYIIRCDEVVRDAAGAIDELRCTYHPDSRSGSDTSGIRPRGVIHWVDAAAAVPMEVHLYDRLLRTTSAGADDLEDALNPDSLQMVTALVEPALAACAPGSRVQFERTGYFYRDPDAPGRWNRTVALRDSWGGE